METKLSKVKCTDANYPPWTCSECAEAAGGRWPTGHVGTFHSNMCPICGEIKGVTEPRDFCYPKYTHVMKEWKDGTTQVIRNAEERD